MTQKPGLSSQSTYQSRFAAAFQQLFPHRYCINLDRRPDRWDAFQKEIYRIGISVERSQAINGVHEPYPDVQPAMPAGLSRKERAQFACALSHRTLIQRAAERGYPNILIFEDDAEFAPDFLRLFFEHFPDIPPKWDALYFGGIYRGERRPVAGRVYQLLDTLASHAYVINHTLYQPLLARSAELLGKKTWDVMLWDMQRQARVFGIIPALIWQRPDYSDIEGHFRDFLWCLKDRS